MAGTSGSTKQVWGLLEQDSIYDRLRRLKHFLHDKHKKYISHQSDRITTHHTPMPCRTHSSRRGTRDKLRSTQDRDLFPVTPILAMYYHLSLPHVGYGSVSRQPLSSTHRTERPWWKISVVAGRQATWSGGMGVSGWDREGRPPLRARDINLIPCYARL